MTRFTTFSFVAAVAMLFTTTASAGTLTSYSSASAYSAAGGTVYVGDSIPGDDVGTVNDGQPNPYVAGPFTFSSDSTINLENDGSYGADQTYLASGSSTLDISLAGSKSLAFLFGSFQGGQSIDIFVNGVSFESLFVPTFPNTQFYGLISSDPITDVTINYSGELDVMSSNPAPSATPEPSSFALLGTGLLGVGSLVGRRFRRA